MIILKVLFGVIFFYYFISTFHRLIFPYLAIYYDFKGIKKHIDTFIPFEIVSIVGLLFLAWIIDEKQFIFNFYDAFIWLVGGFLFLCIHLRGILFFYGLVRSKVLNKDKYNANKP